MVAARRFKSKKHLAPPALSGTWISRVTGISLRKFQLHFSIDWCSWRNRLIFSRCRLNDFTSFQTSIISVFHADTVKILDANHKNIKKPSRIVTKWSRLARGFHLEH
jgi:hypothetical protein